MKELLRPGRISLSSFVANLLDANGREMDYLAPHGTLIPFDEDELVGLLEGICITPESGRG